MRSTWYTALLSIAAAAIPSAAALDTTGYVSYDGYKVFRVKTGRHLKTVQAKLATLDFEKWNHGIDRHIDILLPPNQLDAFEALGLDYHTMHDDLGASIAAESASTSTWKRQSDDLSWYDTYHPYADHVQYFKDLHASFLNNSELISSGTSYEGRDIYGLHLWGAGGPGKPAVLYHGTVHAREWISAPVSQSRILRMGII